MTEPIKLFHHAQMVEYNTARTILSRYYQLYRESDEILVLLSKQGDNAWRKPDKEEKVKGHLFVDNGFFTGTMYYDMNDNPMRYISDQAHDLVRYDEVILALAKAVNTRFNLVDPKCIGYTRRVSDYTKQCIEELSKYPELFTILN
jgi:hypothetical protein